MCKVGGIPAVVSGARATACSVWRLFCSEGFQSPWWLNTFAYLLTNQPAHCTDTSAVAELEGSLPSPKKKRHLCLILSQVNPFHVTKPTSFGSVLTSSVLKLIHLLKFWFSFRVSVGPRHLWFSHDCFSFVYQISDLNNSLSNGFMC